MPSTYPCVEISIVQIVFIVLEHWRNRYLRLFSKRRREIDFDLLIWRRHGVSKDGVSSSLATPFMRGCCALYRGSIDEI